jgi:serine/threonine protein kinase
MTLDATNPGGGDTTCPSCGRAIKQGNAFCGHCGARVDLPEAPGGDPLVGKLVAGSYRVLDVIGEGAMGRVYRAEQANLGRQVALKVMSPSLVAKPDWVERFRMEARAGSALTHPNIVRMLDFGETSDRRPFLVMELLEGRDLDRVLAEQRLLPIPRVLDLILQVLSALEEAHSCGTIHRDLKPANVFVVPQRGGGDLAKVLDFGLAKLRARISTPSGLVFGTPHYLAPEQALAQPSDARADLYSAGVMLFELIAGHVPFHGGDPATILELQAYVDAPDLHAVAPERASLGLAQVVARALRKDPSERFGSAAEFAAALRDVVSSSDDDAPGSRRPSWAQPPPRTCHRCGSTLLPSVRFCGECGAPTGMTPHPTHELELELETTIDSFPGAPPRPPTMKPVPAPVPTPLRPTSGGTGRTWARPPSLEIEGAMAASSTEERPTRPLGFGLGSVRPKPAPAPTASPSTAPPPRPSAGSTRPPASAVSVPPPRTAALRATPKDIEVESAELEDANVALLLLEGLARTRLGVGDAEGAVVALQRAVAIARADLDRGELEDPMRAAAMFSAKLGDARVQAGDLQGAHRAFSESVALTPPGAERTRLLAQIAQIERAGGRSGAT